MAVNRYNNSTGFRGSFLSIAEAQRDDQLITANKTYYVATTGNDNNNGSLTEPWLTIQGAVNNLKKLPITPSSIITLQVQNGTYSAGATIDNVPFLLIIRGNTTTPSSTVITNNITVRWSASVRVVALYINACVCYYTGYLEIGEGCRLTATTFDQIAAYYGGTIVIIGNYSCSGNSANHLSAYTGGKIYYMNNLTLTLVGTPSYSGQFAICVGNSYISFHQFSGTRLTFSGSATGKRYSIYSGSTIDTNGGGGNYLPGNSAGTVDSAAFALYF